jgi:hypothetical protein
MRTILGGALVVLASLVGFACSSESGDTGPGSVSDRKKPVGCVGKCDSPTDVFVSPYVADIAKMNAIWPGEPAIVKVEDAYTVLVDLGQAKFPAPTHLFGAPVNVIPYSNADGIKDAAGKTVERGDAGIAKAFPRGVVGYAIKHHRPEHRKLSPQDIAANMKEQVKLQDTHIEIVVGVSRDGEPGAVTLNNPQDYEQGLFGTPGYSMVFVKPAWPSYLSANQIKAFNDNVRTMIAAFNTVSDFPGDYNGGDPLAAHDVPKLQEHVKQMVLAVGGDSAAQDFFKDPKNLVYCAELAFLGTSAGLHFPLNDATIVPLVGQAAWDAFKAELDKHNAGQASNFTTLNENQRVKYVDLSLAPADLKGMPSYSPDASDAGKLAFKPMTMADILQHFLRTHVPREQLGEQLAPVQGQLLEQMKPGVLEAMAMDQLPAADPKRVAVEQLFDALVGVVKKSYANYAEFQAAVEPLMQQARKMTGPRDDTGTGYFVPPSLLHVVAQGKHPGGLIGLQYVGHGIHWSAVSLPATPPPSNPTDDGSLNVVPPNSPYGKSCVSSCGGSSPDGSCWCDNSCAEYGDCCTDKATACP